MEEGSEKCACYHIPDKSQVLNSHLISFLQLTRLDEKNMRSLAELDPKYQIFIDRLGLDPSNQIKTLKQASQTVFTAVEKQALTLRQLADMTGLTQATLNNFKAGKDVRLSNFLNILKALNLKIKIE